MDADQIALVIRSTCDQQRDALIELVQAVSAPERPSKELDGEAEGTRLVLGRIKAKEFISPDEAAKLFGCSPQHLRNQVQKAIENKALLPIPYRDLNGVIVFPVSELLEWSKEPKQRKTGQPSKGKNKTPLELIAS